MTFSQKSEMLLIAKQVYWFASAVATVAAGVAFSVPVAIMVGGLLLALFILVEYLVVALLG